MSKITLRSFRVADRVKKLGTDHAPIRAIPGKPRSAWREGRVGGAMSAIGGTKRTNPTALAMSVDWGRPEWLPERQTDGLT
jgi:hypothetical protein